jgi:putative flippase GtrA
MLAQLIRFGGVGALATLAHVAVALAARQALPVTDQQANLMGFLAAVLMSYVGHARVTFQAPVGSAEQAGRFAVLALAGLATSSLTVWAMTAGLGLSFGLAMAAVAVLVPLASFFAMRLWVFRAGRGAALWRDIGAATLISAALAALFWNRPLTNDVDWYLIATRDWLAGAALYTTIMEVNPPLNFYYTVPAILTADLLGLSDTKGQYVVVWVLFLGILAWSSAIIRADFGLSPLRHALLLVALAAAVILPSLGSIAQREFLMVVLMLPWLLLQVPAQAPSRRHEVLAAAVAALGMCLKVHFVLFPLAVTVALMLRTRSWRPIFSAANLTFLAVGAGYVGFVALVHPVYLTELVPMAALVYGAYDAAPLVVIGIVLRQALFLGLPVLIAPMDRQNCLNPHPFPAVALAGLAVYVLQSKGFGYHLIPLIAFGLIACVLILLRARRPSPFVAASAVAVLGLVGLTTAQGFHHNYSVDQVVAHSETLGRFDSIIVLTPHVFAGPPVAAQTGSAWASRYPANWLVPGALNRLNRTDCAAEPALCDRLRAIAGRNRSDNIADMIAHRPDLLIVDLDSDYFDVERFDWLAFMAEDPAWAPVFAEYRQVAATARFLFFRRQP